MAEHQNRDSQTPLSPQVSRSQEAAGRIRQSLVRAFKPGDVLPGERKLAERLGVSRKTVRRALAALRTEGWLEHRPGRGHRVTQPQGQVQPITGLYYPFSAEGLVSSRFNREVFVGLTTAASENDRHLLSFCGLCRYYRELQPSRFWSPGMQAVDSMITFEVYKMDLLEQVAKQYPLICLDAPCDAPNVSSVVFDNTAAVQMAFKYLVDLGHRRIGYAGRPLPDVDPCTAQRWEGYHRALKWSGLPSEPSWNVENTPDARGEPELRFVEEWKAMPPGRRPTGMITTFSFWRLVATFLLGDVRVPRDVSLVGLMSPEPWVDALPEGQPGPPGNFTAAWTHGVLQPRMCGPAELASMEPTRAELPARAMGRWGIEEVVRRIADPGSPPRHDMLVPKIVPGDTAAAPNG